MSDDTTLPGSLDIAKLYYSILEGTHPEIVKAYETYRKEICATGYFCCGEDGACNCSTNDGCVPWWTPWWDLPDCGNGKGKVEDPVRTAYFKTMEPIDEKLRKSINYDALYKYTKNLALPYSDERASDVLYNSMGKSIESILAGMIYTYLEAGVIAGYIAGAFQVYGVVMNKYTTDANNFVQSFKPYNPNDFGGGGFS